ncbi:proteasome activator [Pseudonocardia bannensis]|uniref:Bacterial proteasome activator n=1 Tax=Pseudonocardia bannensis TaxID=630973 RepID=A0A848DFA8_9PSEU|nr:proteasome activator [Pseudonocardia bannensis]NMH91231.1 DUF2587 domain-containing protein [Pseudonocardia bannensis]
MNGPADPVALARLGSMVAQLLEESHTAPLDRPGRDRLRDVHARALAEVRDHVSAELRGELDRIARRPDPTRAASEAELRIMQAQLVGWLEGVFAGAAFADALDHGHAPQTVAP